MKIVCVKTPKFLRPFLRLFTRRKKSVKCDSAAAVAAPAPEENNAATAAESGQKKSPSVGRAISS